MEQHSAYTDLQQLLGYSVREISMYDLIDRPSNIAIDIMFLRE